LNKTFDRSASLVFLALGIFIIFYSQNFSESSYGSVIGPNALPQVLGGLFILLSAINLYGTFRAKFEVKGVSSDGNTNIFVGKDSDGTSVFSVDTLGNINANNIPNVVEWTAYDVTIGGSVTNPALPSSYTKTAYYKVIGKTMHIIFSYYHSSSVNSTAGSGYYTLSLPSGYAINTNIATIPSTLVCASGNFAGIEATSVGNGLISANHTNHNPIVVYAASATSLCVYSITENVTLWGNGNYNFNSNYMACKFTAQIPIL
jgi:hypothetical protein